MKQQEEKLEPVKENFMRDAYLEFKTKHPEVSFEQWLLLQDGDIMPKAKDNKKSIHDKKKHLLMKKIIKDINQLNRYSNNAYLPEIKLRRKRLADKAKHPLSKLTI